MLRPLCVYLCRRAVVIVTAMFSQAVVLSPFPAALQPSRLQHSSNTQIHLWSAGTAYWPSLLHMCNIFKVLNDTALYDYTLVTDKKLTNKSLHKSGAHLHALL